MPLGAANIPSECRIASIGPDDAMILPHDANPGRIKFSERTAPIIRQIQNQRPLGELWLLLESACEIILNFRCFIH
jgi:hypothetical protein